MKQAKTKKELDVIKQEVKEVNKKLADLSDDELEYVTGGRFFFEALKSKSDESPSKMAPKRDNKSIEDR